MRRLAIGALVGFVLRGAVTSAVLHYVWRRDGACPECRTPAVRCERVAWYPQ